MQISPNGRATATQLLQDHPFLALEYQKQQLSLHPSPQIHPTADDTDTGVTQP